MRLEFAQAVDPTFLYVLQLLDRIERNVAPDSIQEKIQIRGLIDRAESQLGTSPDWELAKYALVAWVDEVLIDAPWEASEWWSNNSLEFEYYNTQDRQWLFYARAKEAMALTKKDGLEVYYLAVVLGFRGLYGINPDMMILKQADLPPDVESWARRIASVIQIRHGRPPILETPRTLDGAPPLDAKFKLVGIALVFVCLLVGAAVLGVLMFYDFH